MRENPPPQVGKPAGRRPYHAPTLVSYGADELRSFLGVAYAMSSGGDGGGRIEPFTEQLAGRSGGGSSLGRR